MGILDFLKKKEKVVEKPLVVETPKLVENLVLSETIKVVEKQKKVKTIKTSKTTNPLIAKCYKAIEKQIAEDHYDEAKEIIDLSSEEIRNEFLKYHQENNGNICCLVLDKAKRDLIAEGKITYNPEGAFGHPFML